MTNRATGLVEQDYATKKCVDALQAAATAGDGAAMAMLGWRHIARHPDDLAEYANPKFAPFSPVNVLVTPDNNIALEWLRKAAEKKNADAMSYLGWMYFEGHGVKKDETEGVRWFRQSAEAGARRGMAMYGLALLTGQGVAPNGSEGEKWVRRAATLGDRRAMAILANLLLTRDDRPRRPPSWGQMSPAQQTELLVQAVGTPGDDPVAWLRRGCVGSVNWLIRPDTLRGRPPGDLSDPYACYQLGWLYATGAVGVERNLLAADMCFWGVSNGFGDRYSVGWYEVGNGQSVSIRRAAAEARRQFQTIDAQRTPSRIELDWKGVALITLALLAFGSFVSDNSAPASNNKGASNLLDDMRKLQQQLNKETAEALCIISGGRWNPAGFCQ